MNHHRALLLALAVALAAGCAASVQPCVQGDPLCSLGVTEQVEAARVARLRSYLQ